MLTATLDFGGGNVASYALDTATNAGTWDDADTGIHQTVYHSVDPGFPDWWVQFCVDADGRHDEVIVGRGTPSRTPSNWRTPYTATFKRDGVAFHTESVPKHFWYSCWRYTPAMRPVVRTPAQLKARGWIPNFGTAMTPTTTVAPKTWTGPMTLAGINAGMGGAGDNEQIGLLSEAGAAYMIDPTADALTTLLVEAESGGTWQVHMYESDGRAINVRANRLYFGEFAGYGDGVVNEPPQGELPGEPVLDGAHQYASASAAWLLTGDPFYARFIAGICQWHQLAAGYHRINQHIDGLFSPNQTRGMAWGLRDCSLLACTVPVVTPSWMLSRSQWAASLEDNRTYAMRWVNDTGPCATRFQAWTRPDGTAPWMQAWLSSAVGIMVGQGFTEWRPVLEWSIKFQLAHTNGTSGWDRRIPAEYYVPICTAPITSSKEACDATALADWAAVCAYFKAGAGGQTTRGVINDSSWGSELLYSTNASYCCHVRACLAIAANLGIAGARECYDWMHEKYMATYGIGQQSRFAVDPAVTNPDVHPTTGDTMAAITVIVDAGDTVTQVTKAAYDATVAKAAERDAFAQKVTDRDAYIDLLLADAAADQANDDARRAGSTALARTRPA